MQFAVQDFEFLGHRLSASGCSPLVKHSAAISAFPQPTDKPGLQRFLDMINFYRKFLRGAARVLAPLTDALKGPGKTILWTPFMDSTFIKAKQLLSSVPEFVHPLCNAPISLAVDASDSHIGAVLQQQLLDKSWSLLAFFSKKLSDAEKKYSAYDRELLAAYASIRHFGFMLEGREFTIFTDHKPLTHALFRSSPPWSARQQRHLAYLAEFTSSIVHVPDKENVVPDALSRPDLTGKVPNNPALFLATSRIISSSPDLSSSNPAWSIPEEMKLNPSLSVIVHPMKTGDIFCDISTSSLCPLVPLQLRCQLFNQLHNVSHPGVRASRRIIWKICLAWNVQRCRSVGKIMYFLSKISSSFYSSSNPEIFSCSH